MKNEATLETSIGHRRGTVMTFPEPAVGPLLEFREEFFDNSSIRTLPLTKDLIDQPSDNRAKALCRMSNADLKAMLKGANHKREKMLHPNQMNHFPFRIVRHVQDMKIRLRGRGKKTVHFPSLFGGLEPPSLPGSEEFRHKRNITPESLKGGRGKLLNLPKLALARSEATPSEFQETSRLPILEDWEISPPPPSRPSDTLPPPPTPQELAKQEKSRRARMRRDQAKKDRVLAYFDFGVG